MDYLWLKALHIAVVMTWVGGMLVAAVTITAARSASANGAVERSGILSAVRSWDRAVTAPAMLLAWIVGLTLALKGDWFPAPWLLAKLALVFLLSALHGILSGSLRRLEHADTTSLPALLRHGPAATVITVAVIVVLVVTKPL